MAYGFKRSRRSYKRYNRKLTAGKIFGKRSAKAQASQIYALKKRINYIARRDRPETKTVQGASYAFTLDNSSLSTTYKVFKPELPNTGDDQHERNGSWIKIKSLKIFCTMEYFNKDERVASTYGTTGYHDSDSGGCTYRIIAIQSKKVDIDKNTGSTTGHPSLDNLIQSYTSTGAAYTASSILPLKDGITDRFKVLYDRSFTIQTASNQKLHRINLARVNNIRYENNTVNGIYIYVIGAGLHSDTNFIEKLQGTITSKVCFTE